MGRYFYWGEANKPGRKEAGEASSGGTGRTGHPFRQWVNGCPDVGQGRGWSESKFASAPCRTVRITDLIATNRDRYLNERRVQRYRNGGGGRPWVMEAEGEYYLVEGHHRVTAAYRRGEDQVQVRVLRVGGRR